MNFASNKTHNTMKKFLLLLIGFTSSLFLMAMSSTENDGDEQKIKLDKTEQVSNPTNRPREVFDYLEASYNQSSRIISVKHEGLGECDIYLLDVSGEIVDQVNIYSHNYSTESLSVPAIAGVYTVIIDSDVVFAYGTLTVN